MSPSPRHGSPEGDATIAIRGPGEADGQGRAGVDDDLRSRGPARQDCLVAVRDDFVLKGGVLLAAFSTRRATKDIDLQASGLGSDPEEVAERVRRIVAAGLPDGLVFDPASVTASTIRDDDEYAGVRVKLRAILGRARLMVGIDVNFGDPIWAATRLVELARVVPIGLPPVTMLGYPLTMVLAEKTVTALDRGIANTRWRDFADVYTLARLRQVESEELRASLRTVADYRGVALAPLLPLLAAMGEHAQPKWSAWRRRVSREDELPESFTEVLAEVAAFADPVLYGTAVGRWDPATRQWGSGT